MHSMFKYFETKKQYQKKKKQELEESKSQNSKKKHSLSLQKIIAKEKYNNIRSLEKIYINMRYFIRFDGSVNNWGYHYKNPLLRAIRIEVLNDKKDNVRKEING